MSDPVIFSYAIPDSGPPQELTGKAVEEMLKADELAWAHLDANHPDIEKWLRDKIGYLDKIIIDALLDENARPRVTEYEKGAMIILRGVNLNENAEPQDMVALRMWIDENRIITLRRRQIKAVETIRTRLVAGEGPKNAGDFLVQICTRLFQNMDPYISELGEKLDDLEEDITENATPHRRAQVTDIRKDAIFYRRYCAPQKDVMSYLRSSELPWISGQNKRGLQENFEHMSRCIEDLDAVRERAQVIKDELATALSDRLNKNLYIISVVSIIFLPLSFLTGLLGINVGGLPGIDNADAFWVVCALCIFILIIQMIILRLLKWF